MDAENFNEPWDIMALDRDNRGTLIGDATGVLVACTHTESGYLSLSTDDNELLARRIVAAVNACQGISTKALEDGIIPDAIAAAVKDGWYWDDSQQSYLPDPQ